jgi:[ribosomal protein S5]-alanine N-acetyltransferase
MHFMLGTDRLLIRPWIAEDLEDARSLWGNHEVMALLGGPLSPAAVEERLAREMASQAQHGIQYWRVLCGASFVGCCGLKRTDDPEFGVVTELGFHFLPPHWGRGYATEAGRAVSGYAFEQLRVSEVYAGHHPQNAGSRGVLEKLGFKTVGLRFYPPTGLEHPWYRLVDRPSLGPRPSRIS